jgi:hypothetical protein
MISKAAMELEAILSYPLKPLLELDAPACRAAQPHGSCRAASGAVRRPLFLASIGDPMALSINYTDKILAGLNQSYTITSDEGAPAAQVSVEGREIPFRLIRLGPPKDAKESTTKVMKYKISFLLPEDSAGKNLIVKLQAGSSKVEDTKPITET